MSSAYVCFCTWASAEAGGAARPAEGAVNNVIFARAGPDSGSRKLK